MQESEKDMPDFGGDIDDAGEPRLVDIDAELGEDGGESEHEEPRARNYTCAIRRILLTPHQTRGHGVHFLTKERRDFEKPSTSFAGHLIAFR
jgi:hypothetical protein